MKNKIINVISFICLCIIVLIINLQLQNRINKLSSNQVKILNELQTKINFNDTITLNTVFGLTFYSNVVATMYHPVPEQTDDTPNVTADGTMFDIDTASDYRYIAISRDLHNRYGGDLNFNDIVYIKSDNVSGFFIIKDLMNKRFTKRIDFLHSPETPPFKLVDVQLYVTNIKYTE
jgi:3D (Asp-Asp-Asp) domain-containing protein